MRLCLLKLNNKNKSWFEKQNACDISAKKPQTHVKEYGELSLFISVLFDLVFIKPQKKLYYYKNFTIKENTISMNVSRYT